MITNSKGSSHLLPEVFNLYRFKSSFDKVENSGEDILLPILKQFVLLDLGRLRLEEIFALDSTMCLN